MRLQSPKGQPLEGGPSASGGYPGVLAGTRYRLS